MKRIVAGLCLVLLFALGPAGANTAFTVYHLREQDDVDAVFEFGLDADGLNQNPLDHITGASCTGDGPLQSRSAFLSLTARESAAQAAGHADPTATRFWIYRIRPDWDARPPTAVYDVTLSLDNLLSNRSLHLRQRAALRELLSSPVVQETYIARAIPGRWIQSVDHYAWNAITRRVDFVRTQFNPHFEAPEAIASQHVFDADMMRAIPEDDVHRHADAARGPDGQVISVCLLSGTARCRYDGPSQRTTMAGEAKCMRESLMKPGNLWEQAVDVILSP